MGIAMRAACWVGTSAATSCPGSASTRGLSGLGVVALIVHERAVLALAHAGLQPLVAGGQRVGKPRGLDLLAIIDRRRERQRAVAGHQQGQTAWPEVRPRVRGVAALGEGGAAVIAGELRQAVRRVVDQRSERESPRVDHLAAQRRFQGFPGRPGDDVHLIPTILTRPRGGLEGQPRGSAVRSAQGAHGAWRTARRRA